MIAGGPKELLLYCALVVYEFRFDKFQSFREFLIEIGVSCGGILRPDDFKYLPKFDLHFTLKKNYLNKMYKNRDHRNFNDSHVRLNHFSLLEDTSPIEEEDDCVSNQDIDEFNHFLDEQQSKLYKETQSNPTLTKNIIKTFLSILDHSYDLLDRIKESNIDEESDDASVNISEKIHNLDQRLNNFYKIMDKYRDTICSEDGWRRMNRLDFLYEVDIYYNMFICCKSPRYILCALEHSPIDMLMTVDVMFYKDGRKNSKKRYETYFKLLKNLSSKSGDKQKKEELSERDKTLLRKICKRDIQLQKELDKLLE